VNNGVYKDGAAYDNAKSAADSRNIGYAAGIALLLGGVSVHILF
jgi:hypothetical protein